MRVEALARDERKRSLRLPLYAIAASLVALALAWTLGSIGTDETMQRIHTPVAENLTFKLNDGSQVTLGGDSEVEITYSDDERAIRLARGEAYFTVAKDPSRPFRVTAGKARVVAVGTQFNVRKNDDRVVVAVIEGRVRVEPRPSAPLAPVSWLRGFTPGLRAITPQLEPLHLDAGEQAIADDGGVGSAVALPDPAGVAAWREGLLSFQSEPLRYVVERVNRYAAKPIVIENAAIGEQRITGTVVNRDLPEWIASIESALDLMAQEENDRIVLRAR